MMSARQHQSFVQLVVFGGLLAALCALAGCAAGPTPRAQLLDLFARDWEARLEEDPWLATEVGDARGRGRLPSVTIEDLERRAARQREMLSELAAIDRDALPEDDRINAALFERQLRLAVEAFDLGAHEIPFTTDTGFHIALTRLPGDSPFETVDDYEAYIERLHAIPAYIEGQIANLKRGLDRGFTQPRAVLDRIGPMIASQAVTDPAESLFWKPFESFPSGMPESTRSDLRTKGVRAVLEGAAMGYRKLLDFWNEEYLPGARETLGASELPDGAAYYRHAIREYTTLALDPQEIHDTGLAEVERILAEMRGVIRDVGFEGTFAEFLDFLRTDERFYAKTPHELRAEASRIAKRADAKLPAFFGRLPRLPYGVEPVPDHIAPGYTGGRYVPPAEGSHEPGYYWVNTYALESRPLYVLVALTLHEAVPGHHLQYSLAREQGEQPEFRRHDYISAYGEGWALYCEWLGIEMELYEDPYQNFGRLTYEMWRACRLVVDTGIHAMGWSRQQARDYLAERTALSLHEIETEVDRYISWPGQALSYKLGEIEIKRLRRQAEDELGDRFDLREFHDAILATGSVSLDLLQEAVERYIGRRKNDDSRRNPDARSS